MPSAPTFEIEPGQLFIAGQWREAADGARTEVVDPSRGTVLTTVAEASAADVDAAVRAAREAFESGPWAAMTGRERGRILNRVAQLIRQNADEIATLESLDVGKPISNARTIDGDQLLKLHLQALEALGGEIDGLVVHHVPVRKKAPGCAVRRRCLKLAVRRAR